MPKNTRTWFAGFNKKKRVTKWRLQGDKVHSELKKLAETQHWRPEDVDFTRKTLPLGVNPKADEKE